MGVPRTLRTAVAALALLVPLVVPALHGTASAAGAGQMFGTGTYSPGIPTTGCAFQDVSFSGTAFIESTDDPSGVYNVSMNGASTICESLTAGAGMLTVSGDISGTLSYNRTGNVTTMSGTVSIGGSTRRIAVGWACLGIYTGIGPVTEYVWICVWVP